MNGKVLTAEMLERIASHLDDFGEMTPGELAYCGFVMGILATKIDTDMSISMLKFMHSNPYKIAKIIAEKFKP